MPEWQERITRETRPSIRVEHRLRYAAAAPLIRDAPVWCDLGCGAGFAAAQALDDVVPAHVVLVDAAADALEEAAAVVRADRVTSVVADLADPGDLDRVRDLLVGEGAGGVVTCFELIEHLPTHVPLLELLTSLPDLGFTVLLSVPNDDFWGLENPFHETMWGEGAFEELVRMLPEDHVVARQVPVSGSALVTSVSDPIAFPEVTVGGDRIPSHFVAAFGPGATALSARGDAEAADLEGQRAWERQREANLAFLEAEVAELRAWVHEKTGLIRHLESELAKAGRSG